MSLLISQELNEVFWNIAAKELEADSKYGKPFNLPYSKSVKNPVPGNDMVWLIVGDNWTLAKEKQCRGLPVLMIPTGTPLEHMRLPVKGFDVLVLDFEIPSNQYAEYLLYKLSKAGAEFVNIVSLRNESIDGMQYEKNI